MPKRKKARRKLKKRREVRAEPSKLKWYIKERMKLLMRKLEKKAKRKKRKRATAVRKVEVAIKDKASALKVERETMRFPNTPLPTKSSEMVTGDILKEKKL
jgi:hypothetical protein